MKHTDMDIGFIVLCPSKDVRQLRNTVKSVQYHTTREVVCVVGNDASPSDIKDFKVVCDNIYKGKDTITSLMNVGMKRLKHKWGVFLFSGTLLRPMVEKRLCRFIESDKDIIFPILNRKMGFIEGSVDGLMINKDTFEAVGDLPDAKMQKEDLNDFEIAKLMWQQEAAEKGCIFKGIVGVRIS